MFNAGELSIVEYGNNEILTCVRYINGFHLRFKFLLIAGTAKSSRALKSRENFFFLLNTTWNLTCVKYINCIHLGFKFHIDSTTNKFMGTKITQENQIINTTPPLQTVISIIIDMKIEVLLKVSR